MTKISDATWDWLDRVGWCDCPPGQREDQCPRCKAARALRRAQQAPTPTVFRGAVTTRDRKLDF